MKSILDNDTIEVPCPHCGRKLKERIGKLKTSPHLTCPGCGGGIDVNARQLKTATEKVDKQLADLKRSLGRVSK